MLRLKRPLEWLRPVLMGSEAWDYCVVWKLSDNEVLRSIEWIDCCCVGGSDGESCINSPREVGEQSLSILTALCRDTYIPHRASKKSCHALAQLPFSMPLQSGMYGEVIVSGQPRWINFADKLALETLHETTGTQVLIPVVGGLVELFATEQIMENQGITEFVAAKFNASSQLDTIPILNCKNATFIEGEELNYTNSWIHYFQQPDTKPLMADLLSVKFSNHQKLEGSSCSSFPSTAGSIHLSESTSPNQQLALYSPLETAKQIQEYQFKQTVDFNSSCDTSVAGKVGSNMSHQKGKQQVSTGEDKEQQYRSKNLFAERKRRARINRGIWDLRALVPKITKMSQAATLDDAIDYIEEMIMKVEHLQKELEELERDHCNSTSKSELCVSNGVVRIASKLNAGTHEQSSNISSFHKVEVYQLTITDFMIKILCEAKVGAFTRLLETLESLGLQMRDVTATSCKGMVSSSFVVQANNGEIQAGNLRDALVKFACG